jgi:hypothetical protein
MQAQQILIIVTINISLQFKIMFSIKFKCRIRQESKNNYKKQMKDKKIERIERGIGEVFLNMRKKKVKLLKK